MTKDSRKFQMRISRLWILITIALTASIAFLAGCAFRQVIVDPDGAYKTSDFMSTVTNTDDKQFNMPPPVLDRSKSMPETMYTEQQYKVDRAIRNSHHLHIVPSADKKCNDENGSCDASESPEKDSASDDEENHESEDEHLPAGQHLLVDIKNVDASFLDSEERLAQAMVDIVSQSKLTMLSYHCHSLLPMGVSCVGVLLESHISFHTWPVEGVITLDLFTCGSGLLIPLMPLIESLFAIPRPNAGKYIPEPDADLENYKPREEDLIREPVVVWKHELRGFRPKLAPHTYRPLESDIGDVVSDSKLEYKKEVVQVQTPFQLIDIWDIIDPVDGDDSYEQYLRSLRTEINSYESRYPELFAPDRIVFLEGVLQSTKFGDEAYHEAMVHPAMFAHDGPKRVAIIGGGEGATLREVLKHKSVEHVKMIEIDEMMVNVSREYLPGWSDCSDIQGSAKSCFEDERSDIVFDDALAYFINNGLEEKEIPDNSNSEDSEDSEDEQEREKDLYDVIIMDALDPQEMVEFAATLYNSDDFARSLYNSLDKEGVLVMQLGSSPEHNDVAEKNSLNFRRQQIMELVEKVGFQKVQVYEESHCLFGDPWSFIVACKDKECRDNWYRSEALIAYDIHKRIRPTRSGAPQLKYFDGATMKSYQMPSKQWESVFCKRSPKPKSCVIANGYDKKRRNIPIDQFEVKLSDYGDYAGRGIFAKNEMPAGVYVAAETANRKVYVPPCTIDILRYWLENLPKEFEKLNILNNFIEGYGYASNLRSHEYPEYFVDSSILTFMNHGCNNSDNVVSSFFPEMEIEVKESVTGSEEPAQLDRPPFDPATDRHIDLIVVGLDVTKEAVAAGQEMLCDYVDFEEEEDKDDFLEGVSHINDMCDKKALGIIKSLENVKEV